MKNITQYHSLAAAIHTPVAAACGRTAQRLLEGAHPWGSIDVTPTGRTTWTRTRLTVYPPGTNHAERRALQFYRNWPVVGALIALFVMLSLNPWTPLAATGVALLVYVAGFAGALWMTRNLRPRLRRLIVVTVPVGGATETLGDIDSFNNATDQLRTLDRLSRLRLLTPAEYEAGWATIYNSLPDSARASGQAT